MVRFFLPTFRSRGLIPSDWNVRSLDDKHIYVDFEWGFKLAKEW